MNEDLKTQSQELLHCIAKARGRGNQPLPPDALMMIAEEIISRQAFYISLLIEAETKYRQRILGIQDEEKKSFNAAENKARTEETYATYKKAQYVYDLASEQVLLIKRMMQSQDYERRQQR